MRARLGIRIVVLMAIILCLVGLRMATRLRSSQTHAAVVPTTSGTINVDGRVRTYLLHVPPNYDAGKPAPLVLVLHGATQSPENIQGMSGMSLMADQQGFIAVYPSGTGRLNNVPTWNSGNCCGYAQENNVNDVAFIAALIDTLGHSYSIDRKRVFVTGISNGAMMSFRLGCELSGVIAAIAPVEGAQNLPCHPSSPVSVLVFHGTADRLVPFDGGSTPFQIGPRRDDTPVSDTVAFWVTRDACSRTPATKETPSLHTSVYSGCADGTGVALYAIQGGHHIWPGVAHSGNDVQATSIMWDFFAQHPKP
jgi:polyhydroxybutyrate depolymerase